MYPTPNIIRVIKMKESDFGGVYRTGGEQEKFFRGFGANHKGKRSL